MDLLQLDGVQTWSLGSRRGVSVFDMVRAFEAVSGKMVLYRIVARRAGDVAQCWADPSRAVPLVAILIGIQDSSFTRRYRLA